MESKEAGSFPMTEAAPGSSVSSSSPYENEVLLSDALNENYEDTARNDIKGSLSEDEGYVSGNEDFDGEVVGEGNSDAMAHKIESLPIYGVVENDVEKGNKVIEGDDNVVGKESESGVAADDVSEGRVEGLDMMGELGVTSDVVESGAEVVEEGKVVVSEVNEDKRESLSLGDEVSEPVVKEGSQVGDVEPEESEFIDAVEVNSVPEGDSLVDSIHVDVTGPGVVVVGETEENGDVVNAPEEVVAEEALAEPEKPEVVSLGVVGLKSEGDPDTIHADASEIGAEANTSKPKEVDEVVDLGGEKLMPDGESIDLVEPGVAVFGETKENGGENVEVAIEAVDLGDAKLTPGDPVVDSVQVDLVEPGVVGEIKENGVETIEGMVLVGGAYESGDGIEKDVSTREVGAVNLGDAKLTPDGDSVVDSVQVNLVEPGVAVVGEIKENGGEKIEGMELVGGAYESGDDIEKDVSTREVGVVDLGDAKLTPDGDSVVDSVQVDLVEPGVAVVGEIKENGDEKIEGMELVGGAYESGDGIEKDVSTREVGMDVKSKSLNLENVVGEETSETLDAGAAVHLVNGVQDTCNDSIESSGTLENGIIAKTHTNQNQLDISKAMQDPEAIREVEDEMDEEVHQESDEDTDDMIFGSSEAAKKFIEELERESGGESLTGLDQSQRIDGQIVTDSEEEEGEIDDEGEGKELFDSAALAALLKAATGADVGGGNITITSQDGSRLFSVDRPAGLGSSLQSLRTAPRQNRPSLFTTLTPAGGGEVEENLSEEDKKKLEKLQQIRVKFLRLVHRLGLSPEESMAKQVLHRLALLGGRQGAQTFSLDAAKATALQLESGEGEDLDFSLNMMVLGKSGVGKSATINSLLGEEKAAIDAFATGTASVREICGDVDGVKIRVVDTPGLKSSAMEQGWNRGILSSVKKFTKKSPTDVVLYVDRLDARSRDLNDLPLLKSVTDALGSAIWRSAIITLTHGMSAPPDGPSGAPLSYELFISQRSQIVQQSIGHAVGDLRMMSPSLMNPVSLVENHPSCRKNREGQKILPNGQIWRPQLLLLCYSIKILSEASLISKPQDPFDHRKLFGFRARSPSLPYMLSSMLQSRPHPKLSSDQGGDSVDSDIDLDDFSDSDQEEEDEYDQLPPFKPLRKAQMAKLSKEQIKAYFEEYDYRVKLLQKKQWKEELKRMREIKKKGKDAATDLGFPEDDSDPGAAAPVAVPLPDMALPPSFDGDNPAYRYRFLEPTSQFLARPVLDSHGWDHDCGYDGVNLEHSLSILNRLAASYTVQITKDKKDFTISLDSSVAAKQGDNISTMAGFDIQSIGKQLAYIIRGETKIKNLKRNKATGGISFTFLGENIVPGVKIEDQISIGKQYALVGSAGAVRSQHDTAYGANFELQRRELDYPIGQVQSTFSMSIIKWRGDLALGFNSLAQFAIGRNSKVAVRAGINNKMSGQITVRTSSSEHLSLALSAIIPIALSVYKKLYPEGAGKKYSIY